MTRVLIAADDSDLSVETARAAHQLFGDDAEYLLVNVGTAIDTNVYAWGEAYMVSVPLPPVLSTPDGADDDRGPAIDDARSQATEIVHTADIDAEPIGAVGDPAVAILEAARRHSVDVIAVGTHERSWFSRLFRPSVAHDLLREASVPILVVR